MFIKFQNKFNNYINNSGILRPQLGLKFVGNRQDSCKWGKQF